MKSFVTERTSTLCAEEVLWMPSLVQCCDAFLKNRAPAQRALWREEDLVVVFAVRLPVSLEESVRSKRLSAVDADEMLGVPDLADCHQNLAHNWLIAGCTVALRQSQYALLTQIITQLA